MEPSPKRLYRSTSKRMIAGVCGGVAEYLNVDPTVIRIAWILLSILPLIPGILIYGIAWFIIPNAPGGAEHPRRNDEGRSGAAVLGIIFIAVGGLVLLGNLDVLDWEDWWDVSREYVFPLLLIAIGAFLMARPARTPETSEPAGRGKSRRQAPPVPAQGLHRSRTDRKIGGVCGGLAAYLAIDVSIIRVAFVFFTLWPFGLGAVVYLIMMLVIPEESIAKA